MQKEITPGSHFIGKKRLFDFQNNWIVYNLEEKWPKSICRLTVILVGQWDMWSLSSSLVILLPQFCTRYRYKLLMLIVWYIQVSVLNHSWLNFWDIVLYISSVVISYLFIHGMFIWGRFSTALLGWKMPCQAWIGRNESMKKYGKFDSFRHWLHQELSFRQLSMQPVTKSSSKWRVSRFSECSGISSTMLLGITLFGTSKWFVQTMRVHSLFHLLFLSEIEFLLWKI